MVVEGWKQGPLFVHWKKKDNCENPDNPWYDNFWSIMEYSYWPIPSVGLEKSALDITAELEAYEEHETAEDICQQMEDEHEEQAVGGIWDFLFSFIPVHSSRLTIQNNFGVQIGGDEMDGMMGC